MVNGRHTQRQDVHGRAPVGEGLPLVRERQDRAQGLVDEPDDKVRGLWGHLWRRLGTSLEHVCSFCVLVKGLDKPLDPVDANRYMLHLRYVHQLPAYRIEP